MSSINISITEEVYDMLSHIKKKDESFSQVIKGIMLEKDITKCYGLLRDHKESLELIEKEAMQARKERWPEVRL